MVVVKSLDSMYPRVCYEVQKGLIIDMPYGDGKAEIIKYRDGTITVSEGDGKYKVTLKNVQLSDSVDHDIHINVYFSSDDNHLLLENLTFDGSKTIIVSYFGHNVLKGSTLSGCNCVKMAGQKIVNSSIEDSQLDRVEVENSSIKQSYLQISSISDSKVINSDLTGVGVVEDSFIELSELVGDLVASSMVGGVSFGIGWDSRDCWEDDKRDFEGGYFVGNGKRVNQDGFNHGYVEVIDEDAYADKLARLMLDRKLSCALNRDVYCPSDVLKKCLVSGWKKVPDNYRLEILKMFPFLKDVVNG